ncbi:conserved Plasmodium protein, unknown function [Plasmodium reichenowi]|uniref:GRIP domain-containing protein n=1 Tax=Plasmodium reichenowi TaxID=5854 RepID=A0A060RNC9_PLARE|nr:conserved Plasmodium protein, unknown function [Plasmodium reichenowi]
MNFCDNNEMNETKNFMMSNKKDDIVVDCDEYIDGNVFEKNANMGNIYDENYNVDMKNDNLLIKLNDNISFTYTTNGQVEKEENEIQEKQNILHDQIYIDNDEDKYKYCSNYNLHKNEEEHQKGSPNNIYEELDNNLEKKYFYYNSNSKHCIDEKNETNDLENENVVTSMDVSYENVLNDNFIKSRSTSINYTDNSFVLNKENLKSSHHINGYYRNDYDNIKYNDDNEFNNNVSNKDNSPDDDPNTYEKDKKDIINCNIYEENKNNMINIIHNDKENIHMVDTGKNEDNNNIDNKNNDSINNDSINNDAINNDAINNDAINKVNVLTRMDTENYILNEENILPLHTNDDVTKLLDEINDLKNTIENMKKEKINLLSKFKAYTLNNKKELEELKIKCKNKEEQIKMYENKLQNKEDEIMNYVNEIQNKENKIESYHIKLQNKEEEIMNCVNELQNKDNKIESYHIQLHNKEEEIMNYVNKLQNKEEEIIKYVNELQNSDLQKEKKELKTINEVLKNTNEKLEKEITSLLGEMEKIEEENKVLKIFKEEKNKINNEKVTRIEDDDINDGDHNNDMKFRQILLDNKTFSKLIVNELHIVEENILFCFSIDKDKNRFLVCIKQNDDNFFIIPNCIFDEKFPGLQKKTESMIIQDIHEKEILELKNKQMNELYILKKEKEDIYKEYEEYKKKVTSLINETNYNYKNIEEKENEIKELNNTLNKYKDEMNNYKEEIIVINEKYKLLEIELCKEKNIRDQQNVGISDLKKKILKEKIELEKKYKEQYEKETQQKINDMKIIFDNKEKILQDQIDDLLHKIEKLTFSNDEKTKTIENLQLYMDNDDNIMNQEGIQKNEKKQIIDHPINTDEKDLLNYIPDNHINSDLNHINSDPDHINSNVENDYVEKRNKNSVHLSKKEANYQHNINEQENDNNINNNNNNNNNNVEKFKSMNSTNTSIPIYPYEYKKIRKKLETYEILLNEQQEGKKKMTEEINSLKNQVKNYESINGNYQHIIYQKNILSNFIAQIPSRIQVDDYVSVIFNSFNFSNQEIEAINIKRSKK